MKNTPLMKPLLAIAGFLIKIMFSTCRKRYTPQSYRASVASGIGVTWHRGAIFSLYVFASLDPAILVSRSRDGEMLASFIKQLGATPVRGSSSRGGAASLKTMLSLLATKQVRTAATVADGPRGPRYKAKEGMIILAMKSGLPLYPLMWSCEKAWVFKKAWDKTMIPKPFTKVWIEIGQPIHYPSKMNKEDLERARLHLEETLEEMRLRLDGMCGYQDP